MKKALTLLLITLLFSSCSKFQKLMKSTDMEAKYEAAVKYYDKKDFFHALQLFEELISVYRGTTKAESSYYYYSYCTYHVDDFTLAAYHFNNFVQSYPNSRHAEEMQYMYAYCFYLDSPVSSLDQTSTQEAIDKFQLFINKYPSSSRVEEANRMIDELRSKLEEKSFNNAKLYFRTQHYKSAVVTFANLLKDYPASRFKEESLFLSFKSAYYYALNSIESRQEERLKASREEYLKLVDNFPKSRYLREAEGLFSSIESKLAAYSKAQLP